MGSRKLSILPHLRAVLHVHFRCRRCFAQRFLYQLATSAAFFLSDCVVCFFTFILWFSSRGVLCAHNLPFFDNLYLSSVIEAQRNWQ
jgi:hypothetical protein